MCILNMIFPFNFNACLMFDGNYLCPPIVNQKLKSMLLFNQVTQSDDFYPMQFEPQYLFPNNYWNFNLMAHLQ